MDSKLQKNALLFAENSANYSIKGVKEAKTRSQYMNWVKFLRNRKSNEEAQSVYSQSQKTKRTLFYKINSK